MKEGDIINAYELKQYIIENDKTFDVLEALGCTNIKCYTKEYRCMIPNSHDASATSIKKTTLKTKVYSKSKEMVGDIFSLTMDIKNMTFPQSIKHIHKLLGLKYVGVIKKEEVKKKDILAIFKRAKGKHMDYTEEELKIYHEDICREFITIPYIGWIKEGIMPYTQKVFGIGYSRIKDRVCVPWRYWSGTEDEYVGIIGRTLNEDYGILNIPKYFPLISFPKSMTIYGLQENYKYIQEAGSVIVYEAEKSTLKSHSLLMRNAVSLGGHELSDEHIKILLSLDVTIIFAMDKDMEEQLSIDMCNRVKLFRKTGYMYDDLGLLDKKSSPIDQGLKVYQALFKRIKWIN